MVTIILPKDTYSWELEPRLTATTASDFIPLGPCEALVFLFVFFLAHFTCGMMFVVVPVHVNGIILFLLLAE